MLFRPSRLMTLACLWLALATVLAHAVIPIGSPIARQSGSAFSMSTSDVALTPKRRTVPGESRRLLKAGASEAEFASTGTIDHSAPRPALADPPEVAASSGRRLTSAGADPRERRTGAGFHARAPPIA
jgi:hypothetical protein